MLRQLERDAQHVQAVHRHPAGAVGLLDVAAGGQRRAAIEDADVVQAQESALENVVALCVLAVHPPGEIQQQLVKHALAETRDRALPLYASRRSCKRASAAQACTGGFTSPNAHS